MTPQEARLDFLRRLNRVAERLPNGLLQRLVEDAEFFQAWVTSKRRSRGYARVAYMQRWREQAEEKRWREIKRQSG